MKLSPLRKFSHFNQVPSAEVLGILCMRREREREEGGGGGDRDGSDVIIVS